MDRRIKRGALLFWVAGWGALLLATAPARAEPEGPLSDADFNALIAEIDSKIGDEANDEAHAAEPVVLSTRDRVEAAIVSLVSEATEQVPALGVLESDLFARGTTDVAGIAVAITLALLLALRMILRAIRGHGDLSVTILYPGEMRGTFNVRLSKRRSREAWRTRVSNSAEALQAKQRAAAARRTEHTMVARETHFRDVLARRYIVMVYGFVQPIEGEDILSTHLREEEVFVRRARTTRLEFDFHPKECTVDVRVLWDNRPVAEALVALRGTPGSLRYARGGPARLSLGEGTHTLVVGSGDRVAEHTLDVRSFQPVAVDIDLTGRDNVLFSGCPPAVELYLHGDLTAAARALEREGQAEVSHLILARLHHERGQSQTAAEHYEASGRHLEAAEIRQALGQFAEAAALFESAEEFPRAADMWRAAGELLAAGKAFERASRLESAVDCYRELGDVSRWTATLERMGVPLEAAQVAIDRDDWGRAIRSLQQVTLSDPEYVTATNLLIEAYQSAGHLDLALSKTEELVHNQGVDEVAIESCDRLSELLEDSGELDRSLDVLEIIRRRDATYPNVATRIESLRKRIEERDTTESTADIAAQEMFGDDSRYEIEEELGRGGMGIVYRARDRRLGRVVAIKQLPENLRNHPKAVQLFLREARSAAVLNHPNIVTVYDADHEGDILYITMELLEGMPLPVILKARGRLTERDTARLGIQIAGGLNYAHEQRIIHRDIKTGNLFFTHTKKVKIMDFGLAKMVEEVRKASTVIGGTPFYMAPEQSLGGHVDHRADLYALGVTFYELVTGRVPFAKGDVAYHHRHTPAPDPREHIEDLSAEFAELLLQMLEKEPEDRVQTAAEVSERLLPFSRSHKR